MARLLAALLLLWAGPTAHAAVISERPDQVAVTIYHEGAVHTQDLAGDAATRDTGLAMISETRNVDLPEGISEVQFRGVAATMVPQTADLGGLEDAALERNFDYDLLSPGSLLKRSVGETVHLVRTNNDTGSKTEEDAVVMSGPMGTVLKIGNRYEAFHCSDLWEKLVFDHVPDGLIDRPTLTVKVQVKRAGRYTLNLRYIATGLNWSADYVARVRPDGKTLALSGWLTLANFSESSFPAARVDVIAGHVQTTGDDQPPQVETVPFGPVCGTEIAIPLPMIVPEFRAVASPLAAPAPEVEQVAVSGSRIEARNLADYKQYPLPEATDMAARQTKQIQFLDQPAVPFERVYVCRNDDDFSQAGENQLRLAKAIFRLRNTTDQGLGKALPAGDVMTTVIANGEPYLADQGTLQDIPIGLPVELQAGETADVISLARLVEDKRTGPDANRHRLRTLEVVLTNQKPVAVDFEWHQYLFDTTKVTEESQKHQIRNGEASWAVKLAPGEQKLLRYSLDEPG